MKVDKRGYLESQPFNYQLSKDGKIFLYWEGKQVKLLKGKEALKFTSKIASLDEQGVQLLIAKLTGNFKRGNEKGR